MSNLAEISDVEGAWRPLSDAETLVVTNRLVFASAIVRQRVPDIDDRIASGDIDPVLVAGVVAEAIKRVMINPDGKRAETIDDYSYTRDSALSAGSLYLTDDEIALLRGNRSRAFSITPHRAETTYEDQARVAQHREDWGR